jgi:hypothetical protein
MNKKHLVLSLLSLVASAQAGTTTTVSAPVEPLSYDGRPLRPCLCHASYSGEDKPFAINLTANYDSTYFCRGMQVGNDYVGGTLTMDAKLGSNWRWTGSVRYMDLQQTDFSELNLYTGFYYTIGNLTVGPSFRWYRFMPGGAEVDAYDIGVQALYKAGPIDIGGGYYYETESEGSYGELSVSSTIKINDRFALVPSAEISYTDGWLNPALQGWNALALRLSAPIKATDKLTFVPYVGAQFPLEALAVQKDRFVGGISISYSF